MTQKKGGLDKEKLRELNSLTGEQEQSIGYQEEVPVEEEEIEEEVHAKTESSEVLVNGNKILDNSDLPFGGKLYPESWRFAYRSPIVDEVANFSTIEENDHAKQISAMEDLIRKCFTIIDVDSNAQISSGELNDGDRIFYFLKLREFYLHENPISYNVFNTEKLLNVTVNLYATSLTYEPLKEGLLKNYDGRTFNISVAGREEKISFLCPTLNTSKRIVKYMTETRKKVQQKTTTKKDDIDKAFIMFLPYLFETGKETFERLEIKFTQIKKDKVLFDRYMQVISKLNLSNKQQITYELEDEMFESGMEFPSFKSMFIIDNGTDETDDEI